MQKRFYPAKLLLARAEKEDGDEKGREQEVRFAHLDWDFSFLCLFDFPDAYRLFFNRIHPQQKKNLSQRHKIHRRNDHRISHRGWNDHKKLPIMVAENLPAGASNDLLFRVNCVRCADVLWLKRNLYRKKCAFCEESHQRYRNFK